MKPQRRGIPRLWASWQHSWAGFAACWRREEAFRLELIVSLCALPFIVWLERPLWAKLALLATLFIVLLAELFNSALEALVDLASPDIHPLAKITKDIGSASVLLAIAMAAFVWGAVCLLMPEV